MSQAACATAPRRRRQPSAPSPCGLRGRFAHNMVCGLRGRFAHNMVCGLQGRFAHNMVAAFKAGLPTTWFAAFKAGLPTRWFAAFKAGLPTRWFAAFKAGLPTRWFAAHFGLRAPRASPRRSRRSSSRSPAVTLPPWIHRPTPLPRSPPPSPPPPSVPLHTTVLSPPSLPCSPFLSPSVVSFLRSISVSILPDPYMRKGWWERDVESPPSLPPSLAPSLLTRPPSLRPSLRAYHSLPPSTPTSLHPFLIHVPPNPLTTLLPPERHPQNDPRARDRRFSHGGPAGFRVARSRWKESEHSEGRGARRRGPKIQGKGRFPLFSVSKKQKIRGTRRRGDRARFLRLPMLCVESAGRWAARLSAARAVLEAPAGRLISGASGVVAINGEFDWRQFWIDPAP